MRRQDTGRSGRRGHRRGHRAGHSEARPRTGRRRSGEPWRHGVHHIVEEPAGRPRAPGRRRIPEGQERIRARGATGEGQDSHPKGVQRPEGRLRGRTHSMGGLLRRHRRQRRHGREVASWRICEGVPGEGRRLRQRGPAADDRHADALALPARQCARALLCIDGHSPFGQVQGGLCRPRLRPGADGRPPGGRRQADG